MGELTMREGLEILQHSSRESEVIMFWSSANGPLWKWQSLQTMNLSGFFKKIQGKNWKQHKVIFIANINIKPIKKSWFHFNQYNTGTYASNYPPGWLPPKLILPNYPRVVLSGKNDFMQIFRQNFEHFSKNPITFP